LATLEENRKRFESEKTNLVEQEVGEQVVDGEVLGTTRAIALVAEVSDDAHVAEAVTTSGEKCVFYHLHAYWA
jgi:hypothetical protein